jgi:hypothetical protein
LHYFWSSWLNLHRRRFCRLCGCVPTVIPARIVCKVTVHYSTKLVVCEQVPGIASASTELLNCIVKCVNTCTIPFLPVRPDSADSVLSPPRQARRPSAGEALAARRSGNKPLRKPLKANQRRKSPPRLRRTRLRLPLAVRPPSCQTGAQSHSCQRNVS